MQVIKLQVGDKLYVCDRITAFYSKEALSINKDIIELGKRGQQIDKAKQNGEEFSIEAAQQLYADMESLTDRKVNLICKVYGDKFTADDLMMHLTEEEISAAATEILMAARGMIVKN